MKRTPLLALLAFAIFMPVAAKAITMDPVTITLDNPNQTVAAPSSGFITLDFSGTIVVDPNYSMISIGVDDPFNMSQSNFLSGVFDPAFLTFFAGGQRDIHR